MLLVCVLLLGTTSAGCVDSAQRRAIAEIERLEGKFELDANAAHQPLVIVDVSFTKANDASLRHIKRVTTVRELHLCGTEVTNAGLEHLTGLPNLQVLNLWRCKNFTDAGLEHLKGMDSLRKLSLWNTGITDAGLKHVKELTSLQELDLSHTQVTDTGLEEVEALTGLQRLELIACEEITDAGVEKLTKALPGVTITR